MRSFAYAALAASTLLAAVPAGAQVAAPFTGARVEGLVGYDNVKRGDDDDGVMYGIGAGYDMQMRGFVVGVEAEAADSEIKQCAGAQTALIPNCARRPGATCMSAAASAPSSAIAPCYM